MTIIKKIFFLSLLILFISLLFWGVYNLSFKKNSSETEENDTEKITTPITKEQPNIKAITDEAVIAPVFTPDGNFIKYYSKQTGKVFKIDLEGMGKSAISDQELIGLEDVIWSPDKNKVITKFVRTNGEVQFFYYDYETKTGMPIKKNVDEIAWQANSNKIFYKHFDPVSKKRTLNISNPDGTEWKNLADIDYRKVSVSQVPKSGLVSFWNYPDSFTETSLESVPVISGERKKLFGGKFGADYLWNDAGTYALLSYVDEEGGSRMNSAIINYNGGEFRDIGVPTFVSKCVWSKDNKTIYYALPGGISNNAVLPNEYEGGKVITTDTFWKIDITTGEKTRIIDISKIDDKIDASHPFLNSDESILFFTNKVDGKIYRISL
ncbi:MAG TPA: hypothetical protein PLK35_00445 [Candidatus Moranbacteria bacterium]|nr:hypothetical protein [Candidatus Moranbacteria bacterium]